MAFVVSCLSEGLLLVDGDRVERLDSVPSAGLAAAPTRTARAVHDPAETATTGQILFPGCGSWRVPGLRDAHELAWDGDLLACVSTLENAVLWVDPGGRVVRRWNAPGDGDCWHLSGVASAGAGLLVAAFGRFGSHRAWAEADRACAGFVLELPSARVVASGLTSPHSPRLVDGTLLVCDSGRGELVVGSRRVRVGGWPRGVAVTATELAVGVSAPRGTQGHAHLVLVRRSDLSVTRRVPLPVREVFDVAELSAPEALALACPRPALSSTTPLRPADLRAGVEAPESLRLAAGALSTLGCVVTNLGSSTLASASPYPVALVTSWHPGGRALWSPLPRALEPGESSGAPARVLAPAIPGAYRLELRLVQEGVAWLDGRALADVAVT